MSALPSFERRYGNSCQSPHSRLFMQNRQRWSVSWRWSCWQSRIQVGWFPWASWMESSVSLSTMNAMVKPENLFGMAYLQLALVPVLTSVPYCADLESSVSDSPMTYVSSRCECWIIVAISLPLPFCSQAHWINRRARNIVHGGLERLQISSIQITALVVIALRE